MNVLKQCCYRSLKENRKRTIVTIIGIMLATSLITAVACMAVSFRASLIAYEKQQNGDFHYLFEGVSGDNLKYFQNNANIEKIGLAEEVGYAILEGSKNPDKPYLYIRALDEDGQAALSLQLVEGRMPENDTEIVIGRHIRTNGGVDLKVGDVLELQIGSRVSDGWELNQHNSYTYEEEMLETASEKTYTIVGIIERPVLTVEELMAPGYSVFTYMEDEGTAESLEIYVAYTHWGVRHEEQVTAGLLGISEELYNRYYNGTGKYTEEEAQQAREVAKYISRNYWLLKWELMSFSSGTLNMMYAMSAIAIVIIIVASVFCIRNSFVISLTEKMRLYGRLASVGTTSRQQKKIVYYEAVALGITGIPLGIISGLAAAWILVQATGELVKDAFYIGLVFDTSFGAIALAAVLAAVTIFFSASKSARQAAKLSPVSAIRANDAIKANKKKLHCPKTISSFFGIGGTIAYKNLKRAKVKYRTTVISIVVSVSVFIGMTTFVQLLSFASTMYYENLQYQLRISFRLVDDGSQDYERALQMAEIEGVKEAEVVRQAFFWAEWDEIPFTQEYLTEFPTSAEGKYNVTVKAIGDKAYARYCERVGVSVEEAKDKAIVIADYYLEEQDGGKIYVKEGDIAQYSAGDVIAGTAAADAADGTDKANRADAIDGGNSTEETDSAEYAAEIEVLTQTTVKPMSMSAVDYNGIVLIVSDEWMDRQQSLAKSSYVEVYMTCEDAGEIEAIIRNDMNLNNYALINYDASYKSTRSMYLVVSIFLYGFIIVVALIGITNIFNTITTNMELRAPEFAMLKSVGMTSREFKRMIWLEGMFYGGKALIIGIPVGILISFCFHRALGESIVTNFQFPWMGIMIASAAVVMLLFGIMRYSMGKINRRNIIETIQNENI